MNSTGGTPALEKPNTMQKRPDETRTVPGTSSFGRWAGAPALSSRAPPTKATRANSRLTYRHQRQFRYSVSTPPSSSPTAPPVARDGAVDPEGLRPLVRDGERRGEERERGRRQQRAEQALEGAGDDQDLEARGGAADRRGHREADQAGQEDDLPAHQVGDPAAEQQQRTEGQGVGRHDPLAVAVGEAEVLLGGGQGDVHDGGVQDHHQLRQTDHPEHPPPMRRPTLTPGRGASRRGRPGPAHATHGALLLERLSCMTGMTGHGPASPSVRTPKFPRTSR